MPARLLAALLLLAAGCRSIDSRVVAPGAFRTPRRMIDKRPIVTRTLKTDGRAYLVGLTFRDPDKDPVILAYAVDKSSYAAVDADWGYRESDLAFLDQELRENRVAAFISARERGVTQAKLDARLNSLRSEYEFKKRSYVISRGFRFLDDGRVETDMAALVRANAPRLAPLTKALMERARAAGYDVDWLIGAATAMAQLTLNYMEVPPVVLGVHTGGVWPPVKTLVEGWGDCDAKAGLLASILANIPGTRILGIEMSGHYLLGVARRPTKNDYYIRFEGDDYVLIEPAGPDWLPPGDIGDETREFFREGRPFTVSRLY